MFSCCNSAGIAPTALPYALLLPCYAPVSVSMSLCANCCEVRLLGGQPDTHLGVRSILPWMLLSRSAAQAKFFDQSPIAAGAFLAEIGKQAPALTDHHQEAAARVKVVLMDFEVFRKLLDAPGKHGYLHFR